MQIELTCDPAKRDAETLKFGIMGFNKAKVPDLEPVDDEKKVHLFARNERGEVVGGMRATCFWNTLHIELLWVSEAARGGGLGTRLLEAAEAFAQTNGCEIAFVETTSWQARPFYEANGYDLIATLPNRPKGHASHYLTKALAYAGCHPPPRARNKATRYSESCASDRASSASVVESERSASRTIWKDSRPLW